MESENEHLILKGKRPYVFGCCFSIVAILMVSLIGGGCTRVERGVENRKRAAIEKEGRNIMAAIKDYKLEHDKLPTSLGDLKIDALLGSGMRWAYDNSSTGDTYLLRSETDVDGVYICFDRTGRLSVVEEGKIETKGGESRH